MIQVPGPRRFIAPAAAAFALLAMPLLGGRVLAAPGDSDGSFSKDGAATVDFDFFPPPLTGYEDLALQPDGKIVVVGTSGENSEAYEPEVVAARFNADGTLDTSFGKKGRVLVEFPAPDDAVGRVAVAVAADGRILIAADGQNIDLARLNPDGTLDPSFSGDGEVEVALPGALGQSVADLALSPDGRLTVGGTLTATGAGAGADFMLARFTADGTLDPSFSADGFVAADLGADDLISEVALQPDGSVVAAGRSGRATKPAESKLAVARYTAGGELDPSFSGDGFLVSDVANDATGVAVDGSGGIAVSASLERKPIFTVARFTPAGDPDPGFGSGGVTKLSFGDPSAANDLVAAADGSLVVVGTVDHSRRNWQEQDFAIARLDPAGKADRAFSGDGMRVDDLRCEGEEEALSVALDAQSRIVAAGGCDRPVIRQAGLSTSTLAVARFETAAGSADEDGDRVSDSDDRCPSAFGPSGKGKAKGCGGVGRTIVRFEIHKHRASGLIRAADAACEVGQKVSLLKVGEGADRTVASERSDPDVFDFRVPRGRGEFLCARAPEPRARRREVRAGDLQAASKRLIAGSSAVDR